LPKDAEVTLEVEIPGYFPVIAPLKSTSVLAEEDMMDYNENDVEAMLKHELRQELKESIRSQMEEDMNASSQESISEDSITMLKLKEKLKEEVISEIKDEIKEDLMKSTDPGEKDSLISSLKSIMKHEVEKELKNEIEEQEEEQYQYLELKENIELIPIREGTVIRMNHIYFEANKWFIRKESHEQLDQVASFLIDNPRIYVEIMGHTNGLPSHNFCDELSNNRARNVAKYLVEQGVMAERIAHKGYGKRLPIADNDTLVGRKKNQRVELKIIKIEKH